MKQIRALSLILFGTWSQIAFAAPPAISTQPLSQAANAGTTVTFRATATGSGPLQYQWQFNQATLTDKTNAILTLTNAQLALVGDYAVVITNLEGSITSKVARLQLVSGFQLATNSALDQTTGNPIGGAWGDFNHDGWPDLFVDSFQGASTYFLFTNTGIGFVKLPTTLFGANQGGRAGVACADYDNDGWLDLAVCAASGPRLFVYHGETNGTFTLQTNAVFLTPNLVVFSCAWGDYDNDGFVDLFVTDATPSFTGANDLLFHNNGDGTFTKIANVAPARDNAVGQSGVWGDFDNDGRLDLFVASLSGGKNLLYHNDGSGAFTRLTNSVVMRDGGLSGGAAWGDYDNDGDLDLFVTNFTPQSAFLYRNDGHGVFTRITNSIVSQDGSSAGCIWLDFDNDGWLDLVSPAAKNLLYHNNGDGTFTKVTTGLLVAQNYASWGNSSFASADVNRDGFPDLLLVNFGGVNQLYLNEGNSNSWLTLPLEGRLSNRSAIGAKVRVRARLNGQEVWQMREISGGGNYFGQSEMTAAFGLGDATNAEIVRIEWPSGIVQEFRDVRAKQIMTIREPARLKAGIPGENEFRFVLQGGKNVAYEVESSTNLVDWTYQFTVTNSAASLPLTNAILAAPAQYFRVREP